MLESKESIRENWGNAGNRIRLNYKGYDNLILLL